MKISQFFYISFLVVVLFLLALLDIYTYIFILLLLISYDFQMNCDMFSKENADQNLSHLGVQIFFTSTFSSRCLHRCLQYTWKFVCCISTSITTACLYVLHWIVNCAMQGEIQIHPKNIETLCLLLITVVPELPGERKVSFQ